MFKKILLSCFLVFAITNTGIAAPAEAESNQDYETVKVKRKKKVKPIIVFDEEYNYFSIKRLIKKIDRAVKFGHKDIVLKFNSGGGSIIAGNELLHNILKHQSKGVKFTGLVEEYCMSMCFITFQFMDVRLMQPLAVLLDHPASGGQKSDLIEISEILNAMIYDRLKKKGVSEATFKLYKLMVSNEFLINSKTALLLGLTDRVIMPGSELLPAVKKNVKKAK